MFYSRRSGRFQGKELATGRGTATDDTIVPAGREADLGEVAGLMLQSPPSAVEKSQ